MVEATRTANTTGADLHAFIRHRFGMGDRVYGVVDAGRDKELAYAAPRRYGQTIHWLFEEGSGAHMLGVAPYLVPIAFKTRYPYEGSGYLDTWARRLGNNAGVLLITLADPETLLRHLRGVFHVTDEEDQKYFFRFYDPRVLRTYLPTCTAAEGREFFGPVRRFLVESPEPGKMFVCGAEQSGVNVSEEELGRPAESRPRGRYGR